MKKLLNLLFVLSLILVTGCFDKTLTLKEGTYYDKNNMYNGSSLERITLKENKVEKITCGKEAGCSLMKGTYEIKDNVLKITLTHYEDDFDGLIKLDEEELEEYKIGENNSFTKDESNFVFEEKKIETDDSNGEYSVELKKENETFDFNKLHLEFKGTKVEEDYYNYSLNIKYDDKEIDGTIFDKKIASTNMAASFKIYKRGLVYVLVSNTSRQCFPSEALVFNTNGSILNTFSSAEIEINENKITVTESYDGNCMDTSNAKTYNYEISGMNLDLK